MIVKLSQSSLYCIISLIIKTKRLKWSDAGRRRIWRCEGEAFVTSEDLCVFCCSQDCRSLSVTREEEHYVGDCCRIWTLYLRPVETQMEKSPQTDRFKSREIPDLLPAPFQMFWNVVFAAVFPPLMIVQSQLESISSAKNSLWDREQGLLGSWGRKKPKFSMRNIKVAL